MYFVRWFNLVSNFVYFTFSCSGQPTMFPRPHHQSLSLSLPDRGRFAVVRKCTHKDGSKNYAAKFVRKRKMGRSCHEDILKEIRILEMSTNHPRMIRLHEVYETSTEVILVLEL